MRAYPFSTGVLSLAALVFGLSACMNAHQASPLPQQFARGGTSVKAPDAATAGMCSVYSGFGALSYCYDFDETSGTTLLDNSGAGHNGTISATGVTYGAAGLATNSLAAETTDGVTGTMISGFNPSSGSFSTSFYVSLHANLNNFPRLVATGNPAHTTPESGWNIAINNVTTNTVYANIGYGSGYLAFGYIPLALNTPANVTLTYDATSNAVTLCVGTASPPKCVSKTLPAAYAASGNAVVFGGGAKYTPANATFDEAGYWQGTVLTSSQIATLAGLAGVGATPAPTPIATSPPTPLPSSSSTLQGMCAIYGALGSPSYCYDFDEASGPTLLDNSGAGHNGTISASGVSYGATGLTTNSFAAETTDGATGAMTSGFNPSSGSFSTSFFVSLHANTNNLPRLVATGNPAHTTPENGWNVAINNVTTNTVYANIGYGTGYLAFGYIPLALNTSANVALTYDASVNAVTLCVGTASPPKCVTKTLPAAYVASGNPVVFGGGTKYAPASATFDEAAYWQGTVLTSAQIATLAGFAGTGPSPTPTPTPTASLLPASPTPATSATPAPTPSPAPSATVAFNDWPTYGFDAQRSGFNPNTTGITPASIAGGQLHLAWQVAVGASAATQPIVVTNIAGHQALIVVAGHASVYAYDALTGATVWGPSLLGTQPLNGCGTAGVAGTVQYDAALGALFVVAGNGATPSHPVLYKLNVNDGSIAGQVDVTPALLAGETVYAHTAVTFANGLLYFGTASSCESASWRGRVVAVDPVAMALVNTFYMTYGVGGNNFGGGGVWGWGGVSVDPTGNVYAASGNAETPNTLDGGTIAAPFVSTTDEQAGYAEHLVKRSKTRTIRASTSKSDSRTSTTRASQSSSNPRVATCSRGRKAKPERSSSTTRTISPPPRRICSPSRLVWQTTWATRHTRPSRACSTRRSLRRRMVRSNRPGWSRSNFRARRRSCGPANSDRTRSRIRAVPGRVRHRRLPRAASSSWERRARTTGAADAVRRYQELPTARSGRSTHRRAPCSEAATRCSSRRTRFGWRRAPTVCGCGCTTTAAISTA